MKIAALLLILLALSVSVLAAENSAPRLEVSARAENEVVQEPSVEEETPAPVVEKIEQAVEEELAVEQEEIETTHRVEAKAQVPVAQRTAEQEAAYQDAIILVEQSVQETLSALAKVKQEARTIEGKLKVDTDAFVFDAKTLIENESATPVIKQATVLAKEARAADEEELAGALEALAVQAKELRADVYERQTHEGDEVERWWSRVKLWWQFEARASAPEQEIRVVFAEIAASIRGDGATAEEVVEEKSEH